MSYYRWTSSTGTVIIHLWHLPQEMPAPKLDLEQGNSIKSSQWYDWKAIKDVQLLRERSPSTKLKTRHLLSGSPSVHAVYSISKKTMHGNKAQVKGHRELTSEVTQVSTQTHRWTDWNISLTVDEHEPGLTCIKSAAEVCNLEEVIRLLYACFSSGSVPVLPACSPTVCPVILWGHGDPLVQFNHKRQNF